MANTTNLSIPLLEGSDMVSRQKFNEALITVDTNALPIGHESSRAHWPLWEPGKSYSLKDVVRTPECPQWGYFECSTAGTSNSTPFTSPAVEGNSVVDGSVTWILRRLGGVTDLTEIQNELSNVNLEISSLQSNVATANTDISNLQSDLSIANTDIVNLKNKISVPKGGSTGQVLAKKSDADGDIQWQNSAGLQGTFGGEFSTKADLLAFTTPQIGFNYIVTADESQGGARTYYTYITGGIWKYMGAFSDGSVSTGGGGGGYSRQWTSSADVVVNDVKVLSVPYTSTFVVMQPTVLKFVSGTNNIIQVVSEFDNGVAASFAYDSRYVEFIGTGAGSGSQMKLKTYFEQPFSPDTTWAQAGQYAEIDFNLTCFKSVETVAVQ